MNEVQDSENVKFCMNEACGEYRKETGYIIKYGKTEKGVQRYRCMACKKTFTETKGTVFYRLRHSEEEIQECVALVGERKSLAAIHRMKGIKEETVCHWMERIDAHMKHLEDSLLLPYKPRCIQIDGLWSFVGHKGEKGGGKKKGTEEHFGE